MKFKRILAPALLSLVSVAQAQDLGVVIELVSKKSNQVVKSCSATILKDSKNDQCRIVSNAHCVPENSNAFLIFDSKSIKTEIIKRSSRLDLIELKVNDRSFNRALNAKCPSLPTTSTDYLPPPAIAMQGKYIISFRATGWRNSTAVDHFTRNASWYEGKYGLANYSEYSTGPDATDVLIETNHLSVIPGMSGGLLSQYKMGYAGIITRFGPMQNYAYARPVGIVMRWLRDEVKNSGTPEFNATIEQLAASDLKRRDRKTKDTGDNNHANGGDNIHANGGDNNHAGGSDPGNLKNYDYAKRMIKEVDEGYPIGDEFGRPDLKGNVLLAANGQQVDGFSDYLKALQNKSTDIVTRSSNGYPDLKIRNNVFNRLKGEYTSLQLPYKNKPYEILEYPGNVEPWKVVYTGDAATTYMNINTNIGEILFLSYATTASLEADAVTELRMPAKKNIPLFRQAIDIMPIENDGKIIKLKFRYLSGRTSILTCDNKHYFKLICENPKDGSLFSLSYSGDQKKELSYRISYLYEGIMQGRSYIMHYAGTLTKSDVKILD